MVGDQTAEVDAPAGSQTGNPWTRVESALMDTARTLRQSFDRRFSMLDLNLSQAMALALMAEFGPHTQTRIAERLSLGRAATGTCIDYLESRELVQRSPDPEDRRVWQVSCTSAGLDMADRVREIDNLMQAQVRDGLSREERQLLADLLLRIQHNLTDSP